MCSGLRFHPPTFLQHHPLLNMRDDVGLKMASPTPSLDSLTGANSLGSLIDQNDYHSLSNSPATASPTASVSSTFSGNGTQYLTKCFVCDDIYTNPKVLHCLHTFCKDCLECKQEHPNKIVCPRCHHETVLGSRGVADLPTDFVISNIIDSQNASFCTSCKSRTSFAVSRCVDCKSYLCDNCTMAHQFMHCFEGHRVHALSQENGDKEDIKTGLGLANGEKEQGCPRHKTSLLKYFCRTCNVPVCKECTLFDHQSPSHDCEHISEAGPKQIEIMTQAVQEGKNKATDLRNMVKTLEHTAQRLQVQYHKAQNEINDTFQFYRSMLEERKQDLLKELDGVFNAKQMGITVMTHKAQDTVEKIYQVCEFIERLVKCSSVSECLLFKKFMDSRLQALTCYTPDASVQQACDLEFVSNYQAIQVGVRNTFGYVRSSAEVIGTSKQPPIARPTGTNGSITMNGSSPVNGCMNGGSLHSTVNGPMNGSLNGVLERPYSNGLSTSTSSSQYESNIISKRFSSANSLGPFSTSISDLGLNGINHYEKWSSGGNDIFQNGGSEYMSTLSLSSQGDPMLDLSSKFLSSTSIFPPKSQIKRQKMIYHCKFGEFGVLEGQFTEPSGVAVNAQNDIIVADTNNHRIQIFDKEGRFKFQFGECGKRDGQLLYPNRVAVVKTSGDIIVTERSPTHQIQIYNQYGQFVRKFGANILQHPRGVTVDNKGRIVVVECKVMRVIIFDQAGNVLQKFGCSKHLEFPNGVVVNDKQEIFISDNRAHCVKVFNYEGVFLRQIGSEGVTNYPIGVGINSAGEILIADNHNNFNLTIFTQDGQLVSALESKVKHAQCFDVALMDDGSVVLASKDYRLYIYRYVQVPPIGL